MVDSAHNYSSHKDAKGLTAAMLVNLILVLLVFHVFRANNNFPVILAIYVLFFQIYRFCSIQAARKGLYACLHLTRDKTHSVAIPAKTNTTITGEYH